jgi:hypothetical protein
VDLAADELHHFCMRKWMVVVAALAAIVIACGSSSSNGSSGGKPGGTTPPGTTPGGAPPGGTPGGTPPPGPQGGPLAKITMTPATATIGTGKTQQFNATPLDANGNPPSPYPTLTWTVSGGGAVGDTGIFIAGPTEGGPFTVTAASGSISATAQVTIKTVVTTVMIGETNILDNDDSGNSNMVVAQSAALAQPATIKSLTFHVTTVAGNLRLGIYDATGPNDGPGQLKAETNEINPVAGWNTANVQTPVALPAGGYWLAYAPSDAGLGYKRAGDGTGDYAIMQQPYGPLPATFTDMPDTGNDHWSFYATLTSP